MNTSDSFEIFHSKKYDINNNTAIKKKYKNLLYKNYTYVQEVTQGDPPMSNTSWGRANF